MKGDSAFLYVKENFDTSGAELVGRQAASEGFLRAYVRHGGAETLYCLSNVREEFEDFTARVAAYAGRPRPTAWISPPALAGLAKPGCLFRPGPDIGSLAWWRSRFSPGLFSLCGVTHTTADHFAMDALGGLLTAPLNEWDALVCTSQSVRRMVERLLAAQGEWLGGLNGGPPVVPRLKLPVIPLGVACEEFDGLDDGGLRAGLGIPPEAVVLLYVGRMNHVEKANPVPMYLSAEKAAESCRVPVHLIMAGWFHSPGLEEAFRRAAAELAPSVRFHFLDGRRPEVRKHVWFAADMFISLSDNIQETFGLTPIEAMAAGLPVLAGDWDGYRESVRHGQEGLLVPTLAPPPGCGADIAYLHECGFAAYEAYTGAASQSTAIDVEACAQAITSLAEDREMRRRLGEAGRTRAREIYDWRHIVAAYRDLWGEMAEIRRASPPALPYANPLRGDPYALFGHYPGRQLTPECEITLASGFSQERLARLHASPLACPLPGLLLSLAEMGALMERLALSPLRIKDAGSGPMLLSTIGWLGKMGLLKVRASG